MTDNLADQLLHLSDRDLQLLLLQTPPHYLSWALPELPAPAVERLLNHLPEAVCQYVQTAIEEARQPSGVGATGLRVLAARVAYLASAGALETTAAPLAADAFRLSQSLDCPLEAFGEAGLVALLRDLASLVHSDGVQALHEVLQGPSSTLLKQGLVLAADGTEPDLVQDMMACRSQTLRDHLERAGWACIEGMMSVYAGDNPRIVRYKVECLFSRCPTSFARNSPDVSATSIQQFMGLMPAAEWEPDTWIDLFQDMAILARREGLTALEVLQDSGDDALLHRAISLAAVDRVDPAQFMVAMKSILEDQLRQHDARCRMAIAAVEAMQSGKDADETVSLVRRATQESPGEVWRLTDFVEESQQMKVVLSRIREVQQTELNVLLLGETGTGKELVARAIHFGSNRQTARFVAVRCDSLPGDVTSLEQRTIALSRLFGHAMGAFPGSGGERNGLLQEADGGTLFLDGVDHLALPLQHHLYQVLSRGIVKRLGERDGREIRLRVVAGSTMDLAQQVAGGHFDRELHEFLNSAAILLPPLRDRPGDIALLAAAFAERHRQKLGIVGVPLGPEILDALQAQPFPENARQLKRLMERVTAKAGEREVTPADLDLS
jgi:transcriptional regulator with AAA-type ATPase domain